MLSAIAHFDASSTTASPAAASRISTRVSERRRSSASSSWLRSQQQQRQRQNSFVVGGSGDPSSPSPSSSTNLSLLVLDLHRLLHCMERDAADAATANDAPSHNGYTSNGTGVIHWQALEMRMEWLRSLWQQVQHVLWERHRDTGGAEDEAEAPPSATSTSWYRDYEQRVYRACQKTQETIHALQRQEAAAAAVQQQQQDHEEAVVTSESHSKINMIDQIFFPMENEVEQAEDEDEDDDNVELDLIGQPMPKTAATEEEDEEHHDYAKEAGNHRISSSSNLTSRPNNSNHNKNNVDIQAFQKEQREQIEQAIAMMASQMKQETERIHSTLKGQTHGLLDEMEDIATQNVQDVTKVTQDVTTHVQDGWKRSFGTITLFVLVASLFLFSIVTIYMIPKYNSRAPGTPQKVFCRTVQGKEKCLDLDGWIREYATEEPVKKDEEEDESAPYFTTLEDDNDVEGSSKRKQKEAIQQEPVNHQQEQKQEEGEGTHRKDTYSSTQECDMGMDGRCKGLDHTISQDWEDRRRQQQQLEEHLERDEQQKRHQSADLQSTDDLSEEVKAMLELDLNINNLNEEERAMLELEMQAMEGRVADSEDPAQKIAQPREWREQPEGEEQNDRESEEEKWHSQKHTDNDNDDNRHRDFTQEEEEQQQEEEGLQHYQQQGSDVDGGAREFDYELTQQRREELLREREQRENLHYTRQMMMQQEENKEQQDLRERMRMAQEEQLKRRDDFREKELRELEEKRKIRELEEQQRERQLRDLQEWQRQQQEAREREEQEITEQREREKAERKQQQGFDEFPDLPPPPPPSDDLMEQAKGFGAFRDEQESSYVRGAPQAGGATVSMGGFGGGSGGNGMPEVDPFGSRNVEAIAEDTVGGAEATIIQETEEVPFRGRPFAPRDMRRAAASGDNDQLRDYLEQRPHWVDKPDKNNWGAIHLAVRAAHFDAVEILVSANADLNGRTAQGLTPLGMATERLGEGHPIVELLQHHGAEL